MTDTDLVEERLDHWEDERERGREVPVEELCRDRPDLVDRLQNEIDRLKQMDWVDQVFERTTGGQASPTQEKPGDLLEGRYRLQEVIGGGGFGVVWRAEDTLLKEASFGGTLVGGTVAVKLPHCVPHRTDASAGWDEFNKVERLKHPNIVPIHAAGKFGDRYFIVSKFIEGGSLADRIHRGPVDVDEAVRIVREIAVALEFVHNRGVIHRDLKPANILLDAEGRVFLTDFGIALHAAPGSKVIPPTLVGTPPYMAPEQFDPNAEIDHSCDLYALGVILFELLTGCRPYAGGTITELRARERGPTPPAPSERNAQVSRDLDQVVQGCLAKAGERYASAAELIAKLEYLNQPWWRARPRRKSQTGRIGRVARRLRLALTARRVSINWMALVRGCVRLVPPVRICLIGGLTAVALLIAAKFARLVSPTDPRQIFVAILVLSLAIGMLMVGGKKLLVPFFAILAISGGIAFWVTEWPYQIWDSVITALRRNSAE